MNEFTENKLTAKDICSIIKSAKDSGLLKLTYEGLSLEFSSPTAEMVGLNHEHLTDALLPHQNLLPINSESEKDPSPDEDEISLGYDDDLLAITDPEKWEAKQLGILDDAKDGHRQA